MRNSKWIALLAIILVAGVGLTCLMGLKTRADDDEPEETVAEIEETEEPEDEEEAEETAEETEETEARADEDKDPEDKAPEDDKDPAAGEASDGALWTTVRSDLFGTDILIPNLTAGPVEVAAPAGTVASEENGLAFYIVEGTTTAEDIYLKNFDEGFAPEDFDRFIEALEDMGFEAQGEDCDLEGVFTAARAEDGLCVIMENMPDWDYARISYYTMPEGGINGSDIACLG